MLSFREIVGAVYFLSKLEKKIHKTFHLHIATNGTLLNEERVAFFKKNNITVSLSIDSFDATYSERPFSWGSGLQSQSQLEKLVPLYTKYRETFRIKMVVTPNHIASSAKFFDELYQYWFRFINIQPAHGIYWSNEQQDEYIALLKHLSRRLASYPDLQSTTLKRSESHTHTMKRCAKGNSEICIDSYADIYTCDAFLAYDPEVRKDFAFDSLRNPYFDAIKFRKGTDWRYCQNEILADTQGTIERDLTHCKTCNETLSCSKLCNAVPINGNQLDKKILLSNFELFRKIDALT